MTGPKSSLHLFAAGAAILAALAGGAASAALAVCGPFTDVSDPAFCPFVQEIYDLAITAGTTPTTYDPSSSVTRLQMAAFLARTVDRVLERGSRRAALRRFWNPRSLPVLGVTTLPGEGVYCEYDGADLWVSQPNTIGGVSRVRASDGALLGTWTAVWPQDPLPAMGAIFVPGQSNPGALYRIDPAQPPGGVTTVASNLPQTVNGIAFDGARLWTANYNGTVSIVTPGATLPWTVTTTAGGYQLPIGILYDGSNIWITDQTGQTLLRLDGGGAVLQTITIRGEPMYPMFDGSNIWVPAGASLTVVRASTGAVLAILTGNGLDLPFQPAFDGQRVFVANRGGVSLWNATDLTPLGTVTTGAEFGFGACSDGVSFWSPIGINFDHRLIRF